MTHEKSTASAQHWNDAYAVGDAEKSWYQRHATTSARLISQSSGPAESLIDIGGGATTLVDDLLAAGWADVSVLDIADTGMAIARERLGPKANAVTWITADLLTWEPQRTYDTWHDRAVLHFLVNPDQQAKYRRALQRATHQGTHVVIGVFGPDGPQRCSGLPVQRHNAASLTTLLGPQFAITSESLESHHTPGGAEQQFQWITATRVS